MNGIIPQGLVVASQLLGHASCVRAAGYYTMLSLRSFRNELVHSAHFAWE